MEIFKRSCERFEKIDEELIRSKIGTSRWQNPLFQLYWSGQNKKLGIPFR